MRSGWHQVSDKTRLRVEAGKPVKVESSRYDLDGALDDAAQFFGEPLEITREWKTDDGRIVGADDLTWGELVTCGVATSAEVRGDG